MIAFYTRALNAWRGISPEGWKTIGSAALRKAAWGAGIGAAGGLAIGALDNTPGNTIQSGLQGAILGSLGGGAYGAYKGGLNNVARAAFGKVARDTAEQVTRATATPQIPLLPAPATVPKNESIMTPLEVLEKRAKYPGKGSEPWIDPNVRSFSPGERASMRVAMDNANARGAELQAMADRETLADLKRMAALERKEELQYRSVRFNKEMDSIMGQAVREALQDVNAMGSVETAWETSEAQRVALSNAFIAKGWRVGSLRR